MTKIDNVNEQVASRTSSSVRLERFITCAEVFAENQSVRERPLIHIVDLSHRGWMNQMEAVEGDQGVGRFLAANPDRFQQIDNLPNRELAESYVSVFPAASRSPSRTGKQLQTRSGSRRGAQFSWRLRSRFRISSNESALNRRNSTDRSRAGLRSEAAMLILAPSAAFRTETG